MILSLIFNLPSLKQLSPHIKHADESFELPHDSNPIAPYLNIGALVDVARSSNCTLVHPGYGLLSESADFCQQVEESPQGITWVGPKHNVLRLFGDKTAARKLAIDSGVPVVKGSENLKDGKDCLNFFEREKMLLPAILKAAYGGGGRGMRIVRDLKDLQSQFDSCRRESLNAFGRPEVFLEEFWTETKHLEVQVLADGFGNVVHLYERDCTVQHRHQKMVELAPPRDIHPDLREKLTSCAVSLAKNSGYRGAGTVEFLVRGPLDKADSPVVFMEVNPRVQVEHTITEEATGVDIVQSQLLIAVGKSLDDLGMGRQEDVELKNFSVQCRVTMMPGGGDTIVKYEEPKGEGIRVLDCVFETWKSLFLNP